MTRPLHRKASRFQVAYQRRAEIALIMKARDFAAFDRDILLEVARCFRVILATKPTRPPVTSGDIAEQLGIWLTPRSPIFDDEIIASVARAAMRSKYAHISKADEVAELVQLTYDERQAFGIKTIGSIDVDKATRKRLRKKRKRDRDRVRIALQRRASGVLPREVYLARSLSKTRPWAAQGISRASWYRQRKPADETRGTSPSPYHLSTKRKLHTCLTTEPTRPARRETVIPGGGGASALYPSSMPEFSSIEMSSRP